LKFRAKSKNGSHGKRLRNDTSQYGNNDRSHNNGCKYFQRTAGQSAQRCNIHTFNRVSVDGDTSVCDMVVILANGKANNENIVKEDIDYSTFKSALEYVCTHLSKMIAKDGEGATKLIEVVAEGAKSAEDAYKAVSAIAKSPL